MMVTTLSHPDPDEDPEKRPINFGRQKPEHGKLSRAHKAFAHLILSGMTQADAYRQAISPKCAHNTANAGGNKIANRKEVKEYIKSLQEASWTAKALSYAEKRAYLAEVVRTPVGEVTEMSPLAQEVVYEEGKKKVKMFSKAVAIAEDNKMAGDYHADREGTGGNPFGWLVVMHKQREQEEPKVIEIGQ